MLFRSEPLYTGPGSPCENWAGIIPISVFFMVVCSASIWLTQTKNLSVGIIPGLIAVMTILSEINMDLFVAISSISAGVIFFGLLGLVHITLNRETMIWAMYTLLLAFNFDRAFWFTIAIASIIGFILNHPVLYLFGWVFGITKCFGGIASLFAQNYHKGIFEISLGIIVSTGCATVGFNLTKYRAHVVYYIKRAFFAMNAAI